MNLLKRIFNKEKNKESEIKEKSIVIATDIQEKKEEKIIAKNNEYITFHENGAIKEKGFLNKRGEVHGWVIVYDETGKEIEKVQYMNGLYCGNPFSGKTAEEVIEMLGGFVDPEIEVEEEEEYIILDPKKASTLLTGEKYYGKK